MTKLREAFIENAKSDADFCRKYAKQKNGLDYIPWARMHQTVMGKYDGVISSHDVRHIGATAEVEVVVQVRLGDEESTPVSATLAVTDFKNRPIENPTTADVQNTRQRAYAKALSMATSIGLSLWLGHI